LLGIAQYERLTLPVDAAHLGGGKGMACALADYIARARQRRRGREALTGSPAMSAMARSHGVLV
jgi:hypothetical protein